MSTTNGNERDAQPNFTASLDPRATTIPMVTIGVAGTPEATRTIDPKTGRSVTPGGVNTLEIVVVGDYGPIPNCKVEVRGFIGNWQGQTDDKGYVSISIVSVFADLTVTATAPSGKSGSIVIKQSELPTIGKVSRQVQIKGEGGNPLNWLGVWWAQVQSNPILMAAFIIGVLIILALAAYFIFKVVGTAGEAAALKAVS